MNKIIVLISRLNEDDLDLLFSDKNVIILKDDIEIFSFELPIGIDKYSDMTRAFRDNIKKRILEVEEENEEFDNPEFLLTNLDKALLCLKEL